MASPAALLAARLGLEVKHLFLYEQALVHSSYVNEHPDEGLISNERLEYLGDAVVSLIISDALWGSHPDEPEGALTTRRAAVVSTRGLARIATRMDLGSFLLVGQGAERSGERKRGSVLAAAVEAITAAAYLDRGLDYARKLFLEWAAPDLAGTERSDAVKPPKSRLQEHAFALSTRPPVYHVLSAEGPDHAKHYVVEVSIGDERLGRGEGRNRRDAESQAAVAALRALESGDRLEEPHQSHGREP
jgi:ribonuclease-3